ncbi:camp-binding domain-like protein, partial [Rozella allomycis CSF55]
LFENADTDFLDELSRKLLPEIYHDGQLVVKRGEMANEMYLILTGAVEVVSDDLKSVYATITQGSFFGEVGILLKTTRTASVRAKGSVTLLKLTRDDLQTVTKKFPKIENDLKVAAEERYNLFKLRTSPQNEFEFEVNQQNLSKVAIFAKCDREVLNAIASVMTTTKFKKGENIVHCGQ